MNEMQIQNGHAVLSGTLIIPNNAIALVLFAHGSGSSRHSPRNVSSTQLRRQHSRERDLAIDGLLDDIFYSCADF